MLTTLMNVASKNVKLPAATIAMTGSIRAREDNYSPILPMTQLAYIIRQYTKRVQLPEDAGRLENTVE